MSTPMDTEHLNDPELDQLLELLRPTPERDPEALARGRARFLADVDELFEPTTAQPVWQHIWRAILERKPKEKPAMATNTQKFAYSSVLALIMIVIMLLGGASVTAYAAQSALPGETLYPVKTGLEQTQVRLSRDAADQAELHLGFARRRLDEIAHLIDQGRFSEIGVATSEFEFQVQQAIDALQAVSFGDPARANELAHQIAESLSEYATTLSGMLASVPDPVKPTMQQALVSAQVGDNRVSGGKEFSGTIESMQGNNWIVAGVAFMVNSQTEFKGNFVIGDTVKVHTMIADNGDLVAREIEASAEDFNSTDDHGLDDLGGNITDDHGNDNPGTNSTDDHGIDNPAGNTTDDHGNDNLGGNASDDHGETQFTGVLQSVTGNIWVVNGIELNVTSQTEIQGAIAVGTQVEIRATTAADGSLVVTQIKLEDGNRTDADTDDRSGEDNQGAGGSIRNSTSGETGLNAGSNTDSGTVSESNNHTDMNQNTNSQDDSGGGTHNGGGSGSGGSSGSSGGSGSGGGNSNSDDNSRGGNN